MGRVSVWVEVMVRARMERMVREGYICGMIFGI